MPKYYLSTPSDPYRKDLRHVRGDDLIILVTARNEDGTPYDFTGHSFRMQIRRFPNATTIDVDIPDSSFTIQQNQEGIDAGVNNQFKIVHDKADFTSLLPIKYYYDIEITDAAGLVFTPQFGRLEILKDTTR